MPGAVQQFEHNSLQDRDSIVRYLHALADGLSAGRLLLRCGEDSLELQPGELLDLSVRARRRGRRARLTLQVAWQAAEAGPASEATLDISTPQGTTS